MNESRLTQYVEDAVDMRATIWRGTEYGTDRPCEIGRITYKVGVHRYVALTFHYADNDGAWILTWVGFEGRSDAVRLPEGVFPSPAMLAALAVAPGSDES